MNVVCPRCRRTVAEEDREQPRHSCVGAGPYEDHCDGCPDKS